MSFEQERPGYESSTAPRTFDTSTASDSRTGPTSHGGALDDETSRRLDAALHAPYGIDKLLNRLKQSIYSTREFSSFLRERCALEDRHAQGYKKLVRNTSESLRRAEARQGSYSRHFAETMQLNERLAENGLTFSSALHTMSEELRDVADNSERGRKQWKHSFIDAEKKLAEAESAQQKAKERYNNAAEQYDRARTGERAGGKFSLKNKDPAQREEVLKEKADALDKEYATKFEAAQSQRMEFEGQTRRQIVKALREIIDECDAAVAMQMAKLASISEKHIVSNGTTIAPIKAANSDVEPRGLRHIARDMDDKKDFADYMLDGVEPPPQFKGRSRRNTDVDLVHSVSNLPAQRSDTVETPYNASQSHVESRPPQLPLIGGASDSFSRSFEADRPAAQNNRSSYFGGQSDALSSHPTHQKQQTGVITEPGLSNNRAPVVPSLPSYDRSQASPVDNFDNNSGFGRGQGPPRHETMPTAVGIGRTSMDNQPNDRLQGPARQETMPLAGGRGQGVGGDSFPDRSKTDYGHSGMPGGFPVAGVTSARQEHVPTTTDQVRTSTDKSSWNREQGNAAVGTQHPLGRENPYIGNNQDPDPSTNTRDQLPIGRENPYSNNKQGSMAAAELPIGRENPYIGNQRDAAPTTSGRDTMGVGRENPYMNNKADPVSPTNARDQLPVGREHPYTGNNQTGNEGAISQMPVGRENPYLNDSQDHNRGLAQNMTGAPYPSSGTHQSPTEGPGSGRGQGALGMAAAGRGGPAAGRALLPSQQQQQQQAARTMPPPTRPVFGVHLDELFRRDGSAVPAIVFQCIQAVDMFGLSTQGIYRVSGSSPTVQQLKSEFDHGKLPVFLL